MKWIRLNPVTAMFSLFIYLITRWFEKVNPSWETKMLPQSFPSLLSWMGGQELWSVSLAVGLVGEA